MRILISNIMYNNEMGWACGAYGWREGVYRVLVGKSEGKRPMGRPRRRWVDNIRMGLQEVGCGYVDWIGLAQDRDSWRTLVSAVMNLRVPWNAGNLLTSCKLVSFSRRTLHHGESKQVMYNLHTYPLVIVAGFTWLLFFYEDLLDKYMKIEKLLRQDTLDSLTVIAILRVKSLFIHRHSRFQNSCYLVPYYLKKLVLCCGFFCSNLKCLSTLQNHSQHFLFQ